MTQADQNDESNFDRDRKSGRGIFARLAWPILAIALLTLPIAFYGAAKALVVAKSDIREWLPSGFEEAIAYEKFVDTFGIDEMAVISWEGASLDDSRVEALQSMLLEQTIDGRPMFSRVMSGPDLLNQVIAAHVKRDTALSRVAGLTVGLDRKTTCLIAYPNPRLEKGRPVVDRIPVMERIYATAASDPVNISAEDLKLGGPTIDGAVMDIETRKSLQRYLGLTVAVVFLVCFLRFRDLPLAVVAVMFSLLAMVYSLAILHFCGGEMNITMILLPTLCFILGISGCVHMVNYYRNAIAEGHLEDAADSAFRSAIKPCFTANFTTSIGMFSLGVSKIAPIRSFGFFSGLGVLAGLIVILLILPATLHLFGERLARSTRQAAAPSATKARRASRRMSSYINWVCQEHALIVVLFLIGTAVISAGLFWMQSSVKLQSRFAERVKILQDYEWLEEHLGPLVPMEVLIHFTPENQLTHWQKLMLVKRVQDSIRRTTAIRAALSAATFAPVVPKSGGGLVQEAERRSILNRWEKEIERLEEGKLVKFNGESSSWRISTRVPAMNDLDYGVLIEKLRDNIDHQIEDFDQPGISASVTGAIPLLYKAQHQILKDLTWSFITAFVFIALSMALLLRSIGAGLVSMLPNIFAPVIVFGVMGWFGKKVEIGSVLTASIALGIAVDDTIHFLNWYRNSIKLGASRYRAIREAFNHSSRAMIDTSLICSFGVLPFLFSSYMPSFNFALLLIAMLLAASWGALMLLPALLAGPLGNLFKPKIQPLSTPVPVESQPESVRLLKHRA